MDSQPEEPNGQLLINYQTRFPLSIKIRKQTPFVEDKLHELIYTVILALLPKASMETQEISLKIIRSQHYQVLSQRAHQKIEVIQARISALMLMIFAVFKTLRGQISSESDSRQQVINKSMHLFHQVDGDWLIHWNNLLVILTDQIIDLAQQEPFRDREKVDLNDFVLTLVTILLENGLDTNLIEAMLDDILIEIGWESFPEPQSAAAYRRETQVAEIGSVRLQKINQSLAQARKRRTKVPDTVELSQETLAQTAAQDIKTK